MPIPVRFQLEPPPEELIRHMCQLCNDIEEAVLHKDDAAGLLEEWHRHATREYDPYEFTTYWESTRQEDFVREALYPMPTFVEDLTYSEARAVLEAVARAELPPAETSYFLNWLEEQFPGHSMSDLIFWPDHWFGNSALFREPSGAFKPEAELSLNQILGYAMKRSSRHLPGAPEAVVLPFPLPRDR